MLSEELDKQPERDWDPKFFLTRGKCVLCGSAERMEVARRQDGVPLWQCRECGLAYIDPRPSPGQLRGYYDKGYFQGQKDFFAGVDYCQTRDKAILRGAVTGYPEVISHFHLKGKSVLDIGCGSGALLKLLDLHHPARVVGIDIAEAPVAYGRSRYGLDLRSVSLENSGFAPDSFDLILMIDLIEHVETPSKFLLEAQRILRPNGHVFLITPNYRAFSVAASRWICLYKDFEHLQYLSPQSLSCGARRSSLKLISWWTRGIPVFPSAYPRFYKMGFHRILHPNIAWANLKMRLQYLPTHFLHSDTGYELCAILRKETRGAPP